MSELLAAVALSVSVTSSAQQLEVLTCAGKLSCLRVLEATSKLRIQLARLTRCAYRDLSHASPDGGWPQSQAELASITCTSLAGSIRWPRRKIEARGLHLGSSAW